MDQDQAPMGTNISLSDLQWKSFQLRTLSKEVKAPEITYKKENNHGWIAYLNAGNTFEEYLHNNNINPDLMEELGVRDE